MSEPFLLEFSDGQRVPTRGNGVIGRNPGVYEPGTELDDPRRVQRITVHDPEQSVSRAHLAFGQYEGVFWVMDLGSANGTAITYPDGGTFACEDRTRHEVDPGSTVWFGKQSFLLAPG